VQLAHQVATCSLIRRSSGARKKAVGLPLVVSRAFLVAAGETVDGENWRQLGERFERARKQSMRILLATLSECD
jgi:hypothetical protein